MFRFANWLLLAMFLVGPAWASSSDLNGSEENATTHVMTSIHPLALLIKSAWPELNVDHIVPTNQSPHDFALRPSDRGRLENAEFILWLGPGLEPYLSRVLKPRHNHVALLPNSGHFDNPHIWLDPKRITGILETVQTQLELSTPTEFLIKYDDWMMRAQKQFEPLLQKGFVSYHDAFPHWVQFFGLNQLAYVTKDPDHPVGSRHLVEVRKILEEQPVSCLMTEPQFTAKRIDKLAHGLSIPRVAIDPLGSGHLYPNSDFIEFYGTLTHTFVTCLSN